MANDSTPAALKLKTCGRLVRKNGEHVKCGQQFLTGTPSNPGVCPHKDEHLTTIRSGFCLNGNCEGTNKLSYSGRPMKTCEFFVTCPCQCHDSLDKLFAMTGRERILVDSSGYTPAPREFVGPSDDPDYYFSNRDGGDGPRSDEDGPRTAEHAAPVPAYQPTPTGRAARGELESWVLTVFTIWLVEQDGPFTPVYVSREIKKTEGVEPSVGAIDAVFSRWDKLGFAKKEKKPTRLAGISEDGKALGLDKMKARAKMQRRMAQTANKRGTLR